MICHNLAVKNKTFVGHLTFFTSENNISMDFLLDTDFGNMAELNESTLFLGVFQLEI